LDAAIVEHIARHGITPEECEEAYRNDRCEVMLERPQRQATDVRRDAAPYLRGEDE